MRSIRRVGAMVLLSAGHLACGPAVSDHDNRIFATPASIKLSAADLSTAYGSDPGEADRRYRGHVLEVAGVIEKVHPGGGFLLLVGGEKGPVVEASLHEDVAAELLKTFADDQRVTIKCFCEGLDTLVRLKSCVTPDPGR
ncbi:MAG: hypothetical protein ABIP90_08285 [Vicinamibacterales bacterium]